MNCLFLGTGTTEFVVLFAFIFYAIAFACFVCCIILFIKVWRMCNDVNRILQILEQNKKTE